LVALLTLGVTLVISQLVCRLVYDQNVNDQLALLTLSAHTMMSRLEQDMSTRGKEIAFLSQRPILQDPHVTQEEKQRILDSIRKSYPYYAWLGIADAQGNIVVGSDGMLVGKQVAQRDWFVEGAKGLHFGDAHDAFLLGKMLPQPKLDDLPLRLVDVSAPMFDEQGQLSGVICGHLNLDWAFEARQRILDRFENQHIDLLVLNREDKVLMGTASLPSLSMDLHDLTVVNQAKKDKLAARIVNWPDGQAYVTAAVTESGFEQYPGMGWMVIARKSVESAFVAAERLQLMIIGLIGFSGLIVTLFVNRLLTRQLRALTQLSAAAEALVAGDLTVRLPHVKGKNELALLTNSLANLLTRLQRNNQELRLASRVFEDLGRGIMITDANNIIVKVNAAFCQITGYRNSDVIGKNPNLLSSGRHDKAFYRAMWQTLNETGTWQGEIWNRNAAGHVYPEWLTIYVLRDTNGQVSHYVGIFEDISEKKQIEDKLLQLAHCDQLTNLPNRYYMHEQAEKMLAHCQEQHERFALLFVDLDNFKHVNDHLGHFVGDQVLQETAMRFRHELPEHALLARWGGDEFVILITDADSGALSALAHRLMDSLQRPFYIGSEQHYLSASVGIALYPQDGHTVDQLLRCADTAMYQAKASGSNTFRFYEYRMHTRIARYTQVDNGLRRALALGGGGLYMAYQPQFSADGSVIMSLEALVRWQDAELGIVRPDEFVRIAEETGQIVPLGYWIIEAVLNDYRQLVTQGCRIVPIAINCSAYQLGEPDFAERLHQLVVQHNVPVQHIVLEVTESAIMRDETVALSTLATLRQYGYYLSLDDFGTGYSSLSYIHKIRPNEIKVDQHFIADMLTNPDSLNIVQFTYRLAESLQIDLVAEGVETLEQLAAIQAIGAFKIQGYLLAKPMTLAALLPLLGCAEIG
jgi:diguanylate cyclase (GGDEF)-like protein/PAS domain S-box-containing protein